MKIAKTVYKISNWLFLIGVVLQVFLAGMVVVAGQMDWMDHRDLGHMIGVFVILMAILMYVGKAGRQVKNTTWLLLLVYVLQADVLIFLRQSVPVLSALHPVMALLDFWLAAKLLRMDWDAA